MAHPFHCENHPIRVQSFLHSDCIVYATRIGDRLVQTNKQQAEIMIENIRQTNILDEITKITAISENDSNAKRFIENFEMQIKKTIQYIFTLLKNVIIYRWHGHLFYS